MYSKQKCAGFTFSIWEKKALDSSLTALLLHLQLLPPGPKMTLGQNRLLQMTEGIFYYLLHLQPSEDVMKVLSLKAVFKALTT